MSQDKKLLRFPPQFMWGTATASFQIEGGIEARGRTIWDEFCDTPGKVFEGHTGAVACDHFNRYKEDAKLLASLGTPYYRFSIAWARIFPTADGVISKAGVEFYQNLIAELKANGIEPVATLYHWDLPCWVRDKTGGWVGDGSIAVEFERYARACFENLDQVKWWITINEPWCVALLGFENGEHAPGEIDAPGRKCYTVAHHLLRAHAKAVHVYRSEFKSEQNGCIGITLNSDWAEPRARDGDIEGAKMAAERDMEFGLGWFADPVYFGDYPDCMKEACGDRLPVFTDEERELLKGSSEFFGLNHYSTHYTTGRWSNDSDEVNHWKDKGTCEERDDKWVSTDMGWAVVPRGFGRLLEYISEKYKPTGGIIVTENGLAAAEKSMDDMKADKTRISYYSKYIAAMHEAIENGADVRGYFLWSFLDNFEWAFGYDKRFGLFRVDYETQERSAKPAAEWYKKVVKTNAVEWTGEEGMGLAKKA